MNATSRRLALMRHAKAVSSAPEDHARDLAPSGRESAREVGEWLVSCGFNPGRALVSDAVRTSATWEEVSGAAGYHCPADVTQALYTAEPDTALDLIRAVDDEVTTLIVVGHNPTIAFLAQLLDNGDGDPAAGASMMIGFPPASVALFDYEGSWADLAPTGATLTDFRPAVRG
ncbi:MAG TPA: histidine phosphatase family protein [Nocardioides sp.]